MKRNNHLGFLCLIATLFLSACGAIESNSRQVFILVDASGTYASHVGEAVKSANLLTSKLNPKDKIAFAQINSCSFSDDSVIVRETLPGVPSKAAGKKQLIFTKLRNFENNFKATNYTDIRGALRFAAYELEQSSVKRKFIIIYSDMVEDVSSDCDTSNLNLDLSDITVIATNVKKLKKDRANPELFFQRLKRWENIVTEANGSWVHSSDIEQLSDLIL